MPEECPTIVDLEAYLDVGSDVGIGDHVRACAECRRRLTEIRDNTTFLADFAREAVAFRAQRESAGAVGEFPAPPAGYTIRRVLGRGGQAVVYEAVQESTHRRVALKVVRLGARDAARRLRRFDREIELVSNLRHPLIVTVFDSGITPEGDPYLVMEYVEGSPIAHRAGEPVHETLGRFQHVCEAIRYAHRHGVVHRDIKPSNILVDDQGLPRVLDFGLATSLEPRGMRDLTLSGEFLGTPIYAAPEQLQAGASEADVRTDVYALGTILHELLTGEHPFGAKSALADLVTSILEKTPAAPSSVAPGLDDELDTIVLKAMAKEPERRYPSVDALHSDVGRYLRGEPIDAKRDSRWYVLRKTARRYRWAVASGVALIVMLIAFGAVMSALYRQARRTSEELTLALATRDLDRGVELARANNLVSAEPLLWDALLRSMPNGASIRSCAHGPLLQRRAYWGLWELYQHQPCVATVRLGTQRVRLLEVDAPDRIIVMNDRDEIVQWDPHTGALEQLFAPNDGVGFHAAAAMRRDVDRVFLATEETASCWSLSDGRPLVHWPAPDVPGLRWSNLAKTRWGLLIASSGRDGVVRVWDAEQGRLLRTVPMGEAEIYTVLIDDGGRVWAAPTVDGPFETYDLATGEMRVSHETVWAGRLTLCNDGRFIHTGTIWYGPDEKRLVTLEDSPATRASSWEFGANGKRVIGAGNTTPIWDADTGELIRVLASHDGTLCAMGPTGNTVATAHADGDVRAWDITPNAGVRVIPIADTAHCVRFDERGERLVIAGDAGPKSPPILRVVDLAGDRPDVTTDDAGAIADVISSAAFLPGREMLVTGDHDGLLTSWRVSDSTLQRVAQLSLPGGVNAMDVSPDGEWVGVACNESNVYLWRPADGNLRTLSGHVNRIASVAFSADGSELVSGSNDGTVRRWDARRVTALGIVGRHNGAVRAVVFSPDDRFIVSAGDDQRIQVWDARDGRLVRRLSGHTTRVLALAFSPDGTLLASGDASGAVRLWDSESGAALATLDGHHDMVFSLDFSPDGNRLASGAKDQTTRVWDLRYFDRHMAGNIAFQRMKRRRD